MKSIRRVIAGLLVAMLLIPDVPVQVSASNGTEANVADVVLFNTGNHAWTIVDADASEEEVSVSGGDVSGGNVSDSEAIWGDDYFAEDGSYTINIPEANPFFPYEVQFTCDGVITNEWFMTPDDSVVVGGHTFYVSAYFDNTAVTQMTLDVAGKEVVVYPERKEFTDNGGLMPLSLLPLEEKYFTADFTGFTPVELTQVSISSLFAGNATIEDTDSIIWKYSSSSEKDYTISMSGDRIDISRYTYYGGSNSWEMIVGEVDQLAADNTRYIISTRSTASQTWLIPTAYVQAEDGTRTQISVTEYGYYDYSATNRRVSMDLDSEALSGANQAYIGFSINTEAFSKSSIEQVKVYEGNYNSAEEAAQATDITDSFLCEDMALKDAGCLLRRYNSKFVTLVAFDADNQAIGCLPLYVVWYPDASGAGNNYLSYNTPFVRTDTGYVYPVANSYYSQENGVNVYTFYLYDVFSAQDEYSWRLYYYKDGAYNTDAISAAYVGNYDSIADAVAAGAADIKNDLFYIGQANEGYTTNYSETVVFSIFVGEDGSDTQEIYKYGARVEESDTPWEVLSSGTAVTFNGLRDKDGNSVSNYVVNYGYNYLDSYADFNFVTIFVGPDQDVTSLAPTFYTASGVKLYATGSSQPEESGKSLHDFTETMQYTASAEDGANSKNYWVQVVKAAEGEQKLYINSLADEASKTKEEDGIIYSTREVMLDQYHDNIHDILVANVGTEDIASLKVELVSDVLELDRYWTLTGNNKLAGYSTLSKSTSYGELPNLAKIRLAAKDTAISGSDVTGTLTIKSGDTVLMVLTLTGTIGSPTITTKEIPQAVKYVPYGSMIQNSNKYSWNKVSYELYSGSLPEGMIIKPNGELYGVPTEAGEFTFTVYMDNSSREFSDVYKTFTLTVVENTDENVEAATDEGYDLSARIADTAINAAGTTQTMVSEGEYVEFVDLYLDGEKLVSGTDYTSEEGSTRITILTQTLSRGGAGTHTLGIEFRTQGTDELKRAAQNYDVLPASSGGGSSSGGNTSGGNTTGGNTSGGATSSGNTTTSTTGITEGATITSGESVQYVVKSGDTLWKIAKKYYGDGNLWTKIYEDNKATIKNANAIYVGQVIVVYSQQASAPSADNMEVVTYGTVYVVEAGDNLWKIAKKVCGNGRKWKEIYEANKDILISADRIYKGQTLKIPEL